MKRIDEPQKTYLITNVSRMVGLSQKRIREYEKEGLIKPRRDPRTNNRLYMESDIRRIEHIKRLIHEHGFTIACLKYFLSCAPCWIIYRCNRKETCPAYHEPHAHCYEIARAAVPVAAADCDDCAVYLNRGQTPIALLNAP
jgi:MerR family transcriptional regulator, repressor of the yfmOP operon